MSSSSGPNIITNSLVLHLDAADRKSYPGSGTVWTDRSGNGINGTLVNGPTFSSGNAGSIVFDGVNDYIDLGNNILISTLNQFSISFWINMSFMSTSVTAPIVIKSNSIDLLILISEMPGYQGVTIGAGVGSVWATGRTFTPSSFFINNWVQVVVKYNGNGANTISNFNIYENNINKSITSGSGGLFSSTSSNSIIGFIDSTNRLNGKIAQVSIYNKALSSQEIKQNFNATKSRFGLL
jgi:hypothetical protein